MRIWCLRHAQSENVVGGVSGVAPAMPLTPLGHQQAEEAARVLADEPITAIYVSPTVRTQQTAAPLATTHGLDVSVQPGLIEAGIGSADGSTDLAVRARAGEVLRAWVVDQDLDQRVADGETGHEVVARVTAVFEQIARDHDGETVAVVAHTGNLTVTLGRLCGLGALAWGTPLPHAEPFLVTWDGAWSCEAWPSVDLAHP
jgi:alpha-ribazole phosphatase/probable phosphoglycerate mutase